MSDNGVEDHKLCTKQATVGEPTFWIFFWKIEKKRELEN